MPYTIRLFKYASSGVVPQFMPICNWPIISVVPFCKGSDSNSKSEKSDPNASNPLFKDIEAIQPHAKLLAEEMPWAAHYSFEMAQYERDVDDLIASVSNSPSTCFEYSFLNHTAFHFACPMNSQVESSDLVHKQKLEETLTRLSKSMDSASHLFTELGGKMEDVFLR
jgi:hypothetical protein